MGFNEVRSKNESLKNIFQRKLKEKTDQIIAQFTNDDIDQQSINYLSDPFIKSLTDDLLVDHSFASDYEQVWSLAKKWVRARQVTPTKAAKLGSIVHALQTARIVKSDVSRKGTQLKLLLSLQGGQYVLFKPQRYSRQYITDDIYSGADRHNGEIFGNYIICLWIVLSLPMCSSFL